MVTKKNKKILKWILIIGGIALVIYLISQTGDGNLFSVSNVQSAPSSISGSAGGGGIIR